MYIGNRRTSRAKLYIHAVLISELVGWNCEHDNWYYSFQTLRTSLVSWLQSLSNISLYSLIWAIKIWFFLQHQAVYVHSNPSFIHDSHQLNRRKDSRWKSTFYSSSRNYHYIIFCSNTCFFRGQWLKLSSYAHFVSQSLHLSIHFN